MFKFNPFSSSEAVLPKAEGSAEGIVKNPESVEGALAKNSIENISATSNKEEKDTNFNKAISDLREAINIQKELGGKISPEAIFDITGMQPEELLSYLEGKEINVGTEEMSEIMKPIEEALENLDKHYEDPGKLRKFANNKFVRAAFVASMLFLKFAPQAKAASSDHLSKDKDTIKKEWSAENKTEPDLDKTYKTSDKDFGHGPEIEKYNAEKPNVSFEEGKNISKIELTNYFVTDSDKIPESSMKIIGDQFNAFLDKINQDNAKDILSSDFTIYGSSDERPTSSWGGSNENLTSARLQAIDNVLSDLLDHHDFKNLDDDTVKQLKAKHFAHVMPEAHDGKEGGVTYITDKINPETGTNYTAQEVNDLKQNNVEKYNKLLESCRVINFEATVHTPHGDLENIKPIPPVLEKIPPPPPVINTLGEYKNIVLIFDNSPSMTNSYKYIADAVENQIKDNSHNITFGSFSDKLTSFDKCESASDVSKHLESLDHKGSSTENSLSSAIKALEKVESPKTGEKSVLLLMTDESFQDVSMDNIKHLQDLANEKNIEVKFMYGNDQKGEVKQIGLEDLSHSYDDVVKNIYKSHVDMKLKIFDAQVDRLKAFYENKKANLERGSKVITEKDVNEAKSNLDSKINERDNLRSDWNSGDIHKIIENESLKSIKFGGKSIDDKFTVTVEGENIGETIKN